MANPVRQLFPNKEAAARVILVDANGNPYKASGGGGSSVDIQVNGASTSDQSVLNFQDTASVTWANPSGGIVEATAAGGGSGDVVGPASSIDNEIVLFDGTTGKLIKRASTTGILKAASGVIAAAVADTDYATPAGVVAYAQPLDADLTAIAALAVTGLITRTGSGTVAARTITGTANKITVTNGDGVAGNPTITIPDGVVLVAPVLGTPASGVLTNATGLPLSSGVTGTLPVANGGTGVATLAAHGVLLGNGTGAVAVSGAGTAGQVLTSNGASADPTFQAAAGTVLWEAPQGLRLSLTTNVYITTSDVTAAGTLYWTTVISGGTGVVTGYNGTALARKTVQQKNLALTLTSGKNYDVFYDYDGDVLALSAAWTNDTTRADALADEQGAIVLGSDHTKLWLGTIRASGTNICEDSLVKRFCWNAYNQIPRYAKNANSTSHTYATAAWRQWNDVATLAEWVAGQIQVISYKGMSQALSNVLGGTAYAGAALNNTTAANEYAGIATNTRTRSAYVDVGSAVLGYNFLAAMEFAGDDNSHTFDVITLIAEFLN